MCTGSASFHHHDLHVTKLADCNDGEVELGSSRGGGDACREAGEQFVDQGVPMALGADGSQDAGPSIARAVLAPAKFENAGMPRISVAWWNIAKLLPQATGGFFGRLTHWDKETDAEIKSWRHFYFTPSCGWLSQVARPASRQHLRATSAGACPTGEILHAIPNPMSCFYRMAMGVPAS